MRCPTGTPKILRPAGSASNAALHLRAFARSAGQKGHPDPNLAEYGTSIQAISNALGAIASALPCVSRLSGHPKVVDLKKPKDYSLT
jgi:hypothetical protein